MHKTKRGVSAIVATVLLVLITVAAVGIVWQAIIPLIKGSLESSQKCNDAQLFINTQKGFTCLKDGKLLLQIERNEKEFDLQGIQVILGQGGNTKTTNIQGTNANIQPLGGWVGVEGKGEVKFTPKKISDYNGYSIYPADIDSDGDTDIAVSTGQITWYENTVSGFLKHDITNVRGIISVYAADMNKDNKMDIVANYGGCTNALAWYENAGDKTFSERPISTEQCISGSSPSRSVYAVDLESDGDKDIFTSNSGQGFYTLENNGAQIFNGCWDASDTGGSSSITNVHAADINSDGYIDLLGNGGTALYLAINDKQKTRYSYRTFDCTSFTGQKIADSCGITINSADIDSDGKLDILCSDSNTIYWLKNDGNANPVFSKQNVYTVSSAINDVFGADMNGDGKTDIIAAYGDNKLAWLENDGTQIFTLHDISDTQNLKTFYPIDFNKDGDIDIISPDSSSKLTLFEASITRPLPLPSPASRDKTYVIDAKAPELNIVPEKVSIAPIIKVGNKETICPKTAEVEIKTC